MTTTLLPSLSPAVSRPATETLFSEVPERETDLVVLKHNSLIGRPILHGKMSFVARKAFNALCAEAQRVGRPGVNAPIKDQRFSRSYWMRVSDLAQDIGFESKNVEVLREALMSLKGVAFEMHEQNLRGFEHLLSGCWFIKVTKDGRTENAGRSAPLYVAYQFATVFESMVLHPSQYTKMCLLFQRRFTSDHTLALYEALRRFAGSPGNRTCRLAWEEWFHIVSGKPKTAAVPQYRNFKRHVLERSLSEINQVTDIRVRTLEYLQRRSVKDLQFEVFLKNDPPAGELVSISALPQPAADFVESLRERMKTLDVSGRAVNKIFRTHSHEQIEEALKVAEAALRTKPGSVHNPAGYFQTALREGWKAGGGASRPLLAKSLRGEFETIKESAAQAEASQYQRKLRREGAEIYEEMQEEEKEMAFGGYLRTLNSSTLRALAAKKGPLAPICSTFLIDLAKARRTAPQNTAATDSASPLQQSLGI